MSSPSIKVKLLMEIISIRSFLGNLYVLLLPHLKSLLTGLTVR